MTTQWVLINSAGGLSDYVQNITSSQELSFNGALNTFIKATAGSLGITLTIPTAIGFNGQIMKIMMIDTGIGGVSLVTDDTIEPQQTINGSFTYELTNQYQTVSLESDGANWFVTALAN